MYTKEHFYYYQPTNKKTGELPEHLFSFHAFPSVEICEKWLKNWDLNPEDFNINEYKDDDIEDLALIESTGARYPKIEDYPDDELIDGIIDEILLNHPVLLKRNDGESEQEWEDRLYSTAKEYVYEEITNAEESGIYDFSAYGNNPEVDWYDEILEDCIRITMKEIVEV